MRYNIIIIDKGVVGLSIPIRIKEMSPGLKVTILEKENSVAKYQTGNNQLLEFCNKIRLS